MTGRVLPLIALVFVAVAPAASAATVSQTPDITNTHYTSIKTRVDPAVANVTWKIIDLNDEIEVINRSHETVTIYGYSQAQGVSYAGGPYARILPGGTVQINENSQAYYLNQSFFADYAALPKGTPADGEPADWVTVAKTGEFLWHDHRIHWTGLQRPSAVTNVDRRTFIENWVVPIQVGGTFGAIHGQLYWNAEKPFGFPIGAIIAFVAIVIAGAAFVLIVRRRRAQAPAPDAW
jgi:hypothetical protein